MTNDHRDHKYSNSGIGVRGFGQEKREERREERGRRTEDGGKRMREGRREKEIDR